MPGLVPSAGRVVRRLTVLLLLALPLVGGAARPDAHVLLDHGRVTIRSHAAPLTDVLSRFAQATGAQVVYEAARPRQLVSVVIEAASPAEAIEQLLEGQGLNYAVRLDRTGSKVEMLIITGNAGPASASASSARNPRPEPSGLRRPEGRPFEPADEAEPGEVDQPFAPEDLDQPAPTGTSPVDETNPTPGAPWSGAGPGVPPGPEASHPGAPAGSPAPEPDQPQVPAPASYPRTLPESPPAPSPPVYPQPASYPRGN